MRSYTYDPDGNPTSTGSGATTDLKYVGGHHLAGLTHFGARYYDSATTRWTQQDPMNPIASLVEANRYAYAGGNPINATDLAGTSIFKKGAKWLGKNIHDIKKGVKETIPAIDRPGQLGQAWECGRELAKNSLDECDPIELFTGEDVDEAY